LFEEFYDFCRKVADTSAPAGSAIFQAATDRGGANLFARFRGWHEAVARLAFSAGQ
jgi:hypothetical protein